jgi:hypothetical protein
LFAGFLLSKGEIMNFRKTDGFYIFQNQAFYERLGIGKKAKSQSQNQLLEELLTGIAFVLTILIMTLLWIMAG